MVSDRISKLNSWNGSTYRAKGPVVVIHQVSIFPPNEWPPCECSYGSDLSALHRSWFCSSESQLLSNALTWFVPHTLSFQKTFVKSRKTAAQGFVRKTVWIPTCLVLINYVTFRIEKMWELRNTLSEMSTWLNQSSGIELNQTHKTKCIYRGCRPGVNPLVVKLFSALNSDHAVESWRRMDWREHPD